MKIFYFSVAIFLIGNIYSVVCQSSEKLVQFRQCVEKNGVSRAVDLIVDRNNPNSTLYQKLDHRWSTRHVHVHPLAYFVPTTAAHVQIGVRCARSSEIPVIVKSGGHSQELFSSGSAETLVISFYTMNKIEIYPGESAALIESGAVLSHLKKELWDRGGWGISGGICDDVGIGGLVLGGGQGLLSPLYGLTIDNVLEMEMVDSAGNVHVVNENVNADLFWALRGSGSGFIGIVTKIKFKIFDAKKIRMTRVTLIYNLTEALPVFDAYQQWSKSTIDQRNNTYNAILLGYDGPEPIVLVMIFQPEHVTKSSAKNTGEDFFEQVKLSFPPNFKTAVVDHPAYNELKTLSTVEASKDPMYVKYNSFFVNRIFTTTELEEVMEAIKNITNHTMLLIEGVAGNVAHEVSPTATAFIHRGDLYLVSVRINGIMNEEEIKRATVWYEDFNTKAKFMDSGKSYQNYVDMDLGDDYMEKYYGENAERLIQIKTKWDPNNYFKNPQSIPVNSNTTPNVAVTRFSNGFLLAMSILLLGFNNL